LLFHQGIQRYLNLEPNKFLQNNFFLSNYQIIHKLAAECCRNMLCLIHLIH